MAVAKNEEKHPLFTLAEREALVKKAVAHLPNVVTDTFDGLLVEYVAARQAKAIVRGLRAVSDFEFEFQLALMNRKLNDSIETLFLMPRGAYTYLSSTIIKEIGRLGGDLSAFVPKGVAEALREKYGLTADAALEKARPYLAAMDSRRMALR